MDKDHALLEKKREFVDAIKRSRVEIKQAFSDLNKSNGLTLCQVWLSPYGKNKSAVKFKGYYTAALKDYYDACANIEDGSGGLAVKALETYQPYFSRKFIKGELQALLPATTVESSCCLAICLKNIYTGDLDYVFEFIFSVYDVNNPSVFLDSLFLTLKSCLPSFKLSHGSPLGDQSLLVVDVDTLIALEKHEEEDCMDHQLPRSIKEIKYVESHKHPKVEIQEAVWMLTASHGLALCQVWTHHPCVRNENQKRAVKLGVARRAAFKDYYDACVKIQDGSGGLALKALETYQTYFSRNIMKGGKLQALLPATATESCCCLAICLRNTDNGDDVDYAFELFFALYDNNPSVFLDSIFLTLESCLPSFKLASGAQLGHQSRVVDVDNLAERFNFLALIKQEEEEEEEYFNGDVKQQQFGTINATNLNNANDRGELRAMDVRFYVPASLKFADLKKKISQRLHLVSNAYRLTYSVRGVIRPLWIQLESDQDLKMCIGLCRRKKITQLPIRVVPACTTSKSNQRVRTNKSLNAILNISSRLIY